MKKELSLNEACDMISVFDPEALAVGYEDGGSPHPKGYWGVQGDGLPDDADAMTYFPTEQLAFRYRLSLINRLLNG
jgi:hypothetical protein